MTKYKFHLSIFILFLATFVFQAPLNAQTKEKDSPNLSLGTEFTLDSEKDIEELMKNTPLLDTEATIVEDIYKDTYLVASLQNLSRLYWKMNILDISDDKVIDDFLRINECPLYTRFGKDDLEWTRVRKAAKEMIRDNREVYSSKIKAQMPIDLGKYDVEKQGFPLINNTKFDNIRRINIEDKNSHGNLIGNKRDVDDNTACIRRDMNGYPRTILLILDAPITYDFVKVDEHLAQAFLIRRNNSRNGFHNMSLRDFERPAFARLRVTISKYGGPTENKFRGYNYDKEIYMFFGYLDGVDVFEDSKEERLLSSMDFPKSKQRLREEKKDKVKRLQEDESKGKAEKASANDKK